MLVWQKSESEPVCRVGIAGDFLPAGGLTLPEDRTWSELAEGLAENFRDLDVSIANLECPLGADGFPPRLKMGFGGTFSAPEEALEYLLSLGIRIVGLANNHIYDYGEQGLEQTRPALNARQMIPLGSGRTLRDTPEVSVWQGPSGIRVGFWAAACRLSECATRSVRGVEAATANRASLALQEMKKQGATCCVALLHAGLERTNRPEPKDVQLMDSLALLGFDVVSACHSHRISGHKLLIRPNHQPSFCFYGLGSLCSSAMYSPLEREGIVAVVGLNSHGLITRVDARPILLSETGWGAVPAATESEVILRRFSQLSCEIADGSYRTQFYKEVSVGQLRGQFRDARLAFQQGGISGLAEKLGRMRLRHVQRLIHCLATAVDRLS